MTNTAKNIVSNIIGIFLVLSVTYLYIVRRVELTEYIVSLCVGLSLFLFKVSETKVWLEKFLQKKHDQQNDDKESV